MGRRNKWCASKNKEGILNITAVCACLCVSCVCVTGIDIIQTFEARVSLAMSEFGEKGSVSRKKFLSTVRISL